MKKLQVFACWLLFALLPIGASLQAAEPSGGDLSSARDEVTWSGAPLVSNPAACATDSDPACDHFRLTISSRSVKRAFIAIAPAEGFEADDYDLFVYDPSGTLIAQDASADGYESVVIENTGAAYYEVRVQPFTVSPGSSYTGVAARTKDQVFDEEPAQDCLELVPENISLPVLDSGQRVQLSVLLLLDSTDPAVAQAVMARAAESYRPLGIDLVLSGTQAVSFTSTVSEDLIADAKTAVGGTPPAGIDLVGVFTNKTMQGSAGGTTVVGQADCIGGVRFDAHSFFVVSDIRSIENPQTGNSGTLNSLGFNLNVDATAEVMAHEIGHLMGAHHHYANCVEGNLTSVNSSDVSPCTLMFNAVNGASLNFSVLSGKVVRGHAVSHASP